MTYSRIPSEAELDAAAILREHGWLVAEPTCPDCHGWGLIGRIDEEPLPCPQGCEAVATFYEFSR